MVKRINTYDSVCMALDLASILFDYRNKNILFALLSVIQYNNVVDPVNHMLMLH